jgi:cell wall-associated NlpC family hydrolase
VSRFLVALLVAASAAIGGWLAVDSRGDGPQHASAARLAAPTPSGDEQPPLPKSHPKVVEPIAGRENGAPASPPADPVPEDGSADRPPTHAASTARVEQHTVTAVRGGVSGATALPNGIALPPLEAPEEVMAIIEAGNSIARTPYKWGGGHGRWIDTGYDCSGSVSYALSAAGLLSGPLDSGRLMQWGLPGRGKWVTIYASPAHVYMQVAGVRFDTSGAQVTGSRWQNQLRSGRPGFVARHPPGL